MFGVFDLRKYYNENRHLCFISVTAESILYEVYAVHIWRLKLKCSTGKQINWKCW